jgi:hypothetical protein
MQVNLGLLKVLVAKSQPEGLQMHLTSMVEGLLKWQDNTKNHFKAKVGWSEFIVILSIAMANGHDFIHWSSWILFDHF